MVLQALILLLLIGLPFFFREEFKQLISSSQGERLPRVVAVPVIVIVSLLGSALIAFLAIGGLSKIDELPYSIPLSAVNVPEGMSARFSSEQSIRVVISAPRDQWGSLNESAFSATVDIANQKEGTYDLPITVLSKTQNTKIIRVKPARTFVSVEPIIRKTVPVAIRFSGKAGNELVPGDSLITPDKVEVAGPKTVVDGLSQAVARVKLNGETAAIEQKISLVAEASSGDAIAGLSFDPKEVTVSVPLVKAGKLKTVGIKVKVSGQVAAGYWVKELQTDPATVTVTGSAEQLSAIADVSTSSVSLTGINSSTEKQATLSLPTGITLAEGSDTIKVKIILAETETTKTITPTISYDGLAGSLKVGNISPTSLSLVASGTSTTLSSLTGGDVAVKLDLSPYKSAGTYSVSIETANMVLPEGIEVVSFLPSAVDVTLDNK
jgi:YbbR domain-containing protein